ncbi:MAG: hypothetical protein ACFCBU_10185 [Cyanophyceae cyanobacterium]
MSYNTAAQHTDRLAALAAHQSTTRLVVQRSPEVDAQVDALTEAIQALEALGERDLLLQAVIMATGAAQRIG